MTDPVDDVVRALTDMLGPHVDCRWEQTGPCVYCADHGVRLYQGSLPDEKRTVRPCIGQHDWDDGNSESQSGFYLRCLRCGELEWTE